MLVKSRIKSFIKNAKFFRQYRWVKRIWNRYRKFMPISFMEFYYINKKLIMMVSGCADKTVQIVRLLDNIKIFPVNNSVFFYSVDCFKTVGTSYRIFDNYMIDYDMVVNDHFCELLERCSVRKSAYDRNVLALLNGIQGYLARCRKLLNIACKYEKQLDAMESLFNRRAETFFEALQRILFFNQLLWQTGHMNNGLGRLDVILYDLYHNDLENGLLTPQTAKSMLKDFFLVLHEHYWFKSNVLLGDTGQIIILGGRTSDGSYVCNDLTYLFIEVLKELRLPDPKILLRCAADMPKKLLDAAINCIATGIGAPLLSNDDAVIPAMISCGYEMQDAYNYGTAACWEPLVPGRSFDANNVASLNFAVPFTEMLDLSEFETAKSTQEVLELYEKCLKHYIRKVLTPLTAIVFEEDPLLSLVCPYCIRQGKDITRGGANYNNLGLTSVGLSSVINSVLNLDKLVFTEKRYSLSEFNAIRKNNFAEQNTLVSELKNLSPAYGSDAGQVVELTKRLIFFTSEELKKYKAPYGGIFKFGLSSPNYITGAEKIPATFDGRRNGEPFGVHISSGSAIPTTELLSFAMKLDYKDNRLNGNVVDLIISPNMLIRNREKYALMLRAAFAGGIFQLQMNVVDSKTLIAAKADPALFPNLIVRVWGFSAYFNDLPEEYKNILIARALESEKVA